MKHWRELVAYYGARCYYCRSEIATTIDHVVPYSYDQDNNFENLVPACIWCNALASNKTFDNIEQKRQYILNQRNKMRNKRAVCTSCLLPYGYLLHSPSLFLCAECYDDEYSTNYSQKKEWKRWIEQLMAAGIPAEAHRFLKESTGRKTNHQKKVECLIEKYADIFDSDNEFALMLYN